MKVANAYFLVLDIETSSLFNEEKVGDEIVKNPIAVWLAYGYVNLYKANGEKLKRNYFREWNELNDILNMYSIQFYKYKILCFVHNLSYEFDFLIKNISRPIKILSNSTHKVISSTLTKYQNIEFRCTYLLTGYSLRKLGEILNFPKLESDYRCIYPNDKVTDEEKEYCDRDCDIVSKYVSQILLKEYTFLSEIPYTKTGRVRKVLKEFYNEDKNSKDWDLMPPENCYNAMVRAFNGGLAIVNPIFVGFVLKNVHCYDETSAYPYVMLKEQYPYTIRKEENKENFNLKLPFWIAKIRIENIQSKYTWGWLSISKMEEIAYQSQFFNGKLIESEYIERYVTNIDYDLICKTYNFDKIEILEFYPMDKYSTLPKPYIQTIEKFAILKGELKEKLKDNTITEKDREELEKDYMLAKNDFNSIYGMTVQKLMNKEYRINDEFEWEVILPKYEQKMKHMFRNFLFGIYVTAYARRNLLLAIIKNCPYNFVYSDTDSVKFIGDNTFVNTNEPLQQYKNNKYIKDLGLFDYEGDYDLFKTLGAKKYVHVTNNKIDLTVAGLPKTNAIKSIDDFTCGKNFVNCKLGTKYFYSDYVYTLDDDDKIESKYVDENLKSFYRKHNIKTKGGVILYPTSYLLDMTVEDKNYLKKIRNIGGVDAWLKDAQLKSGIHLTEYLTTTYRQC